MSILINGKLISKSVKDEVAAEVAKLAEQGKRIPGLAVVQVGQDPASSIYVRNKEKGCEYVGFKSFKTTLPEDTSEKELLDVVNKLNENPEVDGILCQLPLPNGISSDLIIENIRPDKDVDGFHPVNSGKLLSGLDSLLPCTPAGIIEMLKFHDFDLSGKNAVVLGRSNIVGKPVSLLLQRENLTVTMCHSKTKNLPEICRNADVLVSAMGRKNMIGPDYVNPNQIIIDVSINRDENGKVCGDVDFDAVEPLVYAITPVPGGVGPMTIAMLMKNTLKAYHMHEDK